MSNTTQGRSEWRWPVRVAVAGAASVIVLVAYLADLGTGSAATPASNRSVSATTQPTVVPTDGATSTSAAVTSPTTAKANAPARHASPQPRAIGSKNAAQARPTADGAVLDWLDALGRGDVNTAAALVGPKSRRYIESLGGNVEGLMRGSQEGYGPWARTPDRQSTEVDLGVVDGSPATIVVVSGTPRGEGREGFSIDAIPAIRTASGWVVEPTAFRSDTGGRVEVTTPTHASDSISATAPGSGAFYFSLEDQPPVRVAGERTGGGVRATWDPPGELPTHRHLLVVAYADGDTLTAVANTFGVS